MAENRQNSVAQGNQSEEMLWHVCLKARSFLDVLEGLKIDLGEASDEMEELKKAFEPLMKEKKFLQYIAKLHLDRHQWKEALDAYQRLGADDLESVAALGEIYFNLKNYSKAEEYFTKLLEAEENNPLAWFRKAHIMYLQGNEPEDTVFYLERSLELNPRYLDALVLMGKAWIDRAEKKTDKFIKGRMLKDALSCFDRAEKESHAEKSPLKEFNLARLEALRSKADMDREEEHLEKLAEFLQDAVENDSSERFGIKELVNNERCFADLGIEFVEVQEEGKTAGKTEEAPDAGGEMILQEDISEENNPRPEVPAESAPAPQGRKKSDPPPIKRGMMTPDDIYEE